MPAARVRSDGRTFAPSLKQNIPELFGAILEKTPEAVVLPTRRFN